MLDQLIQFLAHQQLYWVRRYWTCGNHIQIIIIITLEYHFIHAIGTREEGRESYLLGMFDFGICDKVNGVLFADIHVYPNHFLIIGCQRCRIVCTYV